MRLKMFSKAFTLIELMLTIAVMATFATLGIATYQQKMQNAKVEQAAQEIQIWLQAALAYRIHSAADRWPSKDELIENGYVNDLSTPWMHCTAATPPGNCYEVGEAPRSGNFRVTMYLPAALPNAKNIARLIANRLPNASTNILGSMYYVNAEVPLPPQIAVNKDQVIVLNIQTIENPDENNTEGVMVPYPASRANCPANKPFKRTVSLSDFNRSTSGDVLYGIKNVHITDTPNSLATGSTISVTAIPVVGTQGHKSKVTVIDACVPANVPTKTNLKTAQDSSTTYRY